MRRPILFGDQNKRKIQTIQAQPNRTLVQSNHMVEERLRKKRSENYVESLSQLDGKSKILNQQKVQELIQEIQSEFSDLSLDQARMMKGIVAKCYLGAPYEVHTLSLDLEIIHHYKTHEEMPDDLEKARKIALNESYCFIEVYSDCLRPVKWDGGVSVVKG